MAAIHRSRKSRGTRAVVGALGMVFALSACSAVQEAGRAESSGAAAGEGGLETVTLRHSWIPDDLTVPYAMAKEQGFYEDEGINLVDQPGNGGATAAQLVANGDVMFGTGEASHVLAGRENGLDLVSVMQQVQHQPGAVLFFKDSGFTSWEDLADASIGGSPGSSVYLGLEAVFEMKGIERTGEFVSLGPGANFTALQEGDVDAAQSFYGNLATLEFRDDLDALTLADAGFTAPSTALFVTEDFLANNEDLVERFVRATLRGLEAALADPQAGADALASQFANIDAEVVEEIFSLNQQFMETENTEASGLGMHEPDSWRLLADALVEAGELDSSDVESAYTNSVVESVASAA